MADEKQVKEERAVNSVEYPEGLIVSGTMSGKEARAYRDRETNERRFTFRWGVKIGDRIEPITVFVPDMVYKAYRPMDTLAVAFMVRAFSSRGGVSYSLEGLAPGTVLYLENGGQVTPEDMARMLGDDEY